MRNNETGEFELVVGNRQLLSAFFIVVLLFAVSFAMGYVVGPVDPNAPPQPTTQPVQAATPPVVDQQPAGSALANATGAASPDLPAGSYWQVMALGQSAAEAMRQTLKDKGFPVVLTPGRNNLTRVLVGPYSDTSTLGRAKTDLENAGIHPVIFKREQ
jgi:cell division protein FtsN